jgi:hypothetical protein
MGTDLHDRQLGVYVRDHYAAAVAGIALARRSFRENRGNATGDALSSVIPHIEADRETLEHIASALCIRLSAAKVTAARVGEAVGRLKPNGRLRGYSPLGRLLELEALLSGIDAKRSLWRSLARAQRLELEIFDLDGLIGRATWQRDQLVPHHARAAEEAFDELWPARARVAVPA